MTTNHDQLELKRFARYMRAVTIAVPIAREISDALLAEGKDPAGPEFQHRLEDRLAALDLPALIN